MPSMQKYEEIREQLLENPFFCDTAREWKPDISCDVPADIYQDGTRLWAIDKPNISRPPAGWQRLLRIRGEGGTRFADVYYVAPSGKKLRSTVEVQKLVSLPLHFHIFVFTFNKVFLTFMFDEVSLYQSYHFRQPIY
jgi:hypothetical protein